MGALEVISRRYKCRIALGAGSVQRSASRCVPGAGGGERYKTKQAAPTPTRWEEKAQREFFLQIKGGLFPTDRARASHEHVVSRACDSAPRAADSPRRAETSPAAPDEWILHCPGTGSGAGSLPAPGAGARGPLCILGVDPKWHMAEGDASGDRARAAHGAGWQQMPGADPKLGSGGDLWWQAPSPPALASCS